MGQSFGSRYHIIRLLGLGGMGAVYQAWDAELGVAVALKVVRPEIAADPEAARDLERRFKRELLLARQVTHKNVVRIHDLGEIDGIKYITMPYIEGDDLSTILTREGKLPVPRVLRIARTIVAGLQAAHEAGVVHRDLKPANVMIDAEDEALIMDFGIARSSVGPVEPGAKPGTARLPRQLQGGHTQETLSGAIVGTVQFMAPEQARGEAVDHRADIYAFGLILYDMLVGKRRAGHANSAVAELQARMQQSPPAVRTIEPEVPEPLDALITGCIETDVEKRYPTTAALAEALDRLDDQGHLKPLPRRFTPRVIAAAAGVLAILLTATWWLARGPGVAVAHEPVSVLIANFENRARDPVFENSLERALSVGIEGASFITSFDRQTARRLAEQLKPGSSLDESTARLVATREGIKVILAGAIDANDGAYTLTVKGIDPSDGKMLWTGTGRARSKQDVLGALAQLAADTRKQLGDTAPKSTRLAAAETFTAGSLEAVRDYSIAQDLFTSGKFGESAEYFQRAVSQDPNFGRAYAGWATSAYFAGRKDEAAEQWKKALSLMDRMTEREKYRTLGTYYLAIARNYEKAIENYRTLVKLYPTDLAGHNNLAVAYFSVLNFPQALEEGRRAVQLYPRNMVIRNNYALYAMYAGDFATAKAEAERLIQQNASFYKNYLPLAVAALASGKPDTAREAYTRMAQTGAEGASIANLGLADMAMYLGQYAEAEAELKTGVAADEQEKRTATAASKYVALAELYTATNRKAQGLAALDKALALGRQEAVLVPAARLYLQLGREADVQALAAELENQLQTQTRAWARLVDGEVAVKNRRIASAIDAFRDSIRFADFWLTRYNMGVAYEAAGHHAEALAELEACMKRRGEASAIFLDDMPSFRYAAALPYWLGRAQQGLGQQAAAAKNFKSFLDLRVASPGDPLVIDARKRAPQ